MKINDMFKSHTVAFALMATVAALALPATARATSDEGGAGMSAGSSASDTGYTVQQSTPAGQVPAALPQNDAGGAGSTTGAPAADSGYTINQSTPASVVPAEIPAQDTGGSGVTTGAGSAAGTLSNQVKGTIDSIDAARRKVTIRDSQGNLSSYKLKAGAKVQVQGHKAALSSLTKGDSVIVVPAANDPTSATSISVGS